TFAPPLTAWTADQLARSSAIDVLSLPDTAIDRISHLRPAIGRIQHTIPSMWQIEPLRLGKIGRSPRAVVGCGIGHDVPSA
ncbi:hypothetical protein, partial [Sphingobium sp. UBA5915]|uniref:hypothetical protein n=1 Tax=Sphingobium sp. UBA5915 TaxID=1947530 RepID=UPI0025DCBF90